MYSQCYLFAFRRIGLALKAIAYMMYLLVNACRKDITVPTSKNDIFQHHTFRIQNKTKKHKTIYYSIHTPFPKYYTFEQIYLRTCVDVIPCSARANYNNIKIKSLKQPNYCTHKPCLIYTHIYTNN